MLFRSVKNVSVFLQTQIFGKFHSSIIPLIVRGIDFSNSYEANQFNKYVLSRQSSGGFFVGEELKDKFGLKNKLLFYSLGKKLQLKQNKISGVFKVGLYSIDNYYVISDLPEARSLDRKSVV